MIFVQLLTWPRNIDCLTAMVSKQANCRKLWLPCFVCTTNSEESPAHTLTAAMSRMHVLSPHSMFHLIPLAHLQRYRGADKSLARPTSRFILFDGENISFDASLVIYINSTNISPIMIINRIYEHQNLLSL